MNAQELAAALDGIEYPVRVPSETLRLAKDAGLVIIHGGSDDLIEFGGFICDEAGCYGGGIVRFDADGVIPPFEDVEHEAKACREWAERDTRALSIEAKWDPGDGYSWTYETAIPYATFTVMDDGERYCRGIVFEYPKSN